MTQTFQTFWFLFLRNGFELAVTVEIPLRWTCSFMKCWDVNYSWTTAVAWAWVNLVFPVIACHLPPLTHIPLRSLTSWWWEAKARHVGFRSVKLGQNERGSRRQPLPGNQRKSTGNMYLNVKICENEPLFGDFSIAMFDCQRVLVCCEFPLEVLDVSVLENRTPRFKNLIRRAGKVCTPRSK